MSNNALASTSTSSPSSALPIPSSTTPVTIETKPALVGWSVHVEGAAPTPPAFPSRLVRIYHPTLSDVSFFDFPVVDTGATVHYGAVVRACHIFCGNKDGLLWAYDAKRQKLGERVELQWDQGLKSGDYTWRVEAPGGYHDEWPFVPSFREWVPMAEEELPIEWRSAFPGLGTARATAVSDVTKFAKRRDDSCRVSGGKDALEGAHVIPKAEEAWFRRNIQHFDGVLKQINSARNCYGLAKNMRFLYDNKTFVLVPKNGRATVHFLSPAFDIFFLYSNRFSHNLKDSYASVHYSRFAWSIFGLAVPFLQVYLGRTSIKVLVGVEGEWGIETGTAYRERLNMSKTPVIEGAKKRKRSEAGLDRKSDEDEGEDSFEEGASHFDDSESEELADQSHALEPTFSPPPPPSSSHFTSLDAQTQLEIMSYVESDEAEEIKRECLCLERRKNQISEDLLDEEIDVFGGEENELPFQLKGDFAEAGEWYRQAKEGRSKTRPKEIVQAFYGVTAPTLEGM